MSEKVLRTVDPFLGKEVEISHRLTDRLRGRYAHGPTMPNGEPEFGWLQFDTPSIQHEAASEIERLRPLLDERTKERDEARAALNAHEGIGPEILSIMETYDRQMEEYGYADTPGGLEHIGDVWKMLNRWRDELKAAQGKTP